MVSRPSDFKTGGVKMESNSTQNVTAMPYEERIRGAFVQETTHLKRRKESGSRLSNKTIVVALVASLFLLHYLLTGSWTF